MTQTMWLSMMNMFSSDPLQTSLLTSTLSKRYPSRSLSVLPKFTGGYRHQTSLLEDSSVQQRSCFTNCYIKLQQTHATAAEEWPPERRQSAGPAHCHGGAATSALSASDACRGRGVQRQQGSACGASGKAGDHQGLHKTSARWVTCNLPGETS